jgi:hypothetical protein
MSQSARSASGRTTSPREASDYDATFDQRLFEDVLFNREMAPAGCGKAQVLGMPQVRSTTG